MSYDTVVIGAGLAGLTAALRLTEQGQRVLMVARGVGATHLAPATVDVLGYLGDARVESPVASLPALLASSPDHPYRHVSADQLATALAWFGARAGASGYVGTLAENMLLPTALGVAKPSALSPRTMTNGDLRAGGRFVFVGFRGFKSPWMVHKVFTITGAEPPAGWIGQQSRTLDAMVKPSAEVKLAAVRPVKTLLDALAHRTSSGLSR